MRSIHRQTEWLIDRCIYLSLSKLSLAHRRCYADIRWPMLSDTSPLSARQKRRSSDLSSLRYRAGCCSRRHVPGESLSRRCPCVQCEAAVGVRWHLEKYEPERRVLLAATAQAAPPSVKRATTGRNRFRGRFQNKSRYKSRSFFF